VAVYPFAFHIAVQPQFKTLWSRLLLYELEPSRASLVLFFKPLLMTLHRASVLMSLSSDAYPWNWPAWEAPPVVTLPLCNILRKS